MVYTKTQYRRERQLVAADHEWSRRVMRENGLRANFITAEQNARKPKRLKTVDNNMRGRVEQFEILRDLPDRFTAYMGCGSDHAGAIVEIGVWTGNVLGRGQIRSIGPRKGWTGERQRYGRVRIGGRLYAFQGPGAGMYCRLRAIKGKR